MGCILKWTSSLAVWGGRFGTAWALPSVSAGSFDDGERGSLPNNLSFCVRWAVIQWASARCKKITWRLVDRESSRHPEFIKSKSVVWLFALLHRLSCSSLVGYLVSSSSLTRWQLSDYGGSLFLQQVLWSVLAALQNECGNAFCL